jgi:phosphopantothenate synthetase
MTSEEQFGISPQPKETCPMIDEVISYLKKIEQAIYRHEKLEEDELRSVINDVDCWVSGLTDTMESIRENTSSIRDWGNEWKSLAKKIISNKV